MKSSTIELINSTVNQAKTFPNCTIQYNFDELPEVEGITPDSFFGIPARFNPDVNKATGCIITYKYA